MIVRLHRSLIAVQAERMSTRVERRCTQLMQLGSPFKTHQSGLVQVLPGNRVAPHRFLAIPLLSAERAWAMAMEIKGQLDSGPAAPKRQHLQVRLTVDGRGCSELLLN